MIGSENVPNLMVYMRKGRTEEQKEKLILALTSAVCQALGVPERSVSIILNEVPDTDWGSGGKPFTKIFGSKS